MAGEAGRKRREESRLDLAIVELVKDCAVSDCGGLAIVFDCSSERYK